MHLAVKYHILKFHIVFTSSTCRHPFAAETDRLVPGNSWTILGIVRGGAQTRIDPAIFYTLCNVSSGQTVQTGVYTYVC